MTETEQNALRYRALRASMYSQDAKIRQILVARDTPRVAEDCDKVADELIAALTEIGVEF